jgi:hypothetical protein
MSFNSRTQVKPTNTQNLRDVGVLHKSILHVICLWNWDDGVQSSATTVEEELSPRNIVGFDLVKSISNPYLPVNRLYLPVSNDFMLSLL